MAEEDSRDYFWAKEASFRMETLVVGKQTLSRGAMGFGRVDVAYFEPRLGKRSWKDHTHSRYPHWLTKGIAMEFFGEVLETPRGLKILLNLCG